MFVASSRLGRSPEDSPNWFDAIRTLATRVANNNHCFLTATRTAADPFVRRIGQLWRLPVFEFLPFPQRQLAQWLEDVVHGSETACEIYYSPCISQASSIERSKEPADILLAEFACRVVVLKASPNGNTFRAVQRRLERAGGSGSRTTELLVDDSLIDVDIREHWLNAGASGWWLYRSPQADEEVPPASRESRSLVTVLSSNAIDFSDYLFHWTRKPTGLWPQQTQAEYLDNLIFGLSAQDRSCFASLCRLLASSTLLASSKITRSRLPVTCWTAVPLSEFRQRRQYRSHLARWDFELNGLAIKKQRLVELGARQVIYGDDATWKQLAEEDRPFFQIRYSANGKIDWQQEREWRTLANVDLRKIGVRDAFVFVENERDAERIGSLSRWPVLIVP